MSGKNSESVQADWVNTVELVARVSSGGETVELPSGDSLTRFRVVVPREKPVTKTTIDTIDCVSFKQQIQNRALKLEIDDVVKVSGQLRRRFWKTGVGVASRMEVEVNNLKIVKA